MDPDGRILDSSDLEPSDSLLYEKALKILNSTSRGKELISRLESSSVVFKINTNKNGKNNYSPSEKKINWDPSKIAYTLENAVISSEVLLAHEMGHAEQDLNNELPIYPSGEQILDIEHLNIKKTEIPIAKELGMGQRKTYDDWRYYRNINGITVNSLYDCPYKSYEIQLSAQKRRFDISHSLLRLSGIYTRSK